MLWAASDTLRYNFNNLLNLGIPNEKIASCPVLLLRNPDEMRRNYRYLLSIGIDPKLVQNHPILLASNSDAFAKALRILKLDILGLTIFDKIEVNKYTTFYNRSPATLLPKIQYLTENDFNYLINVRLLGLSWSKMIERALRVRVTKQEANKISQKYSIPLKKRYDEWMKEYKLWSDQFAKRRGQRLIRRV